MSRNMIMSFGLKTTLVVLALIFATPCVLVRAETIVGTRYDVPSQFGIQSHVWKTEFQVARKDAQEWLGHPSISFGIKEENAPSLKLQQIVRWDEDSNAFIIYPVPENVQELPPPPPPFMLDTSGPDLDSNQNSGATRSSATTAFSIVTLVTLIGLVLVYSLTPIGFSRNAQSSQDGRVLLIVACVLVATVVGYVHAQKQLQVSDLDGFTIVVTLHVHENEEFNAIDINITEGSFMGGDELRANSLNLNLCNGDSSKNNVVTNAQLDATTIEICARGHVDVPHLQIPYDGASVNIKTTNANVDVQLSGGDFGGTVKANSGASSFHVQGGSCTLSGQTYTCGESDAIIDIDAGSGAITVGLGVTEECPITHMGTQSVHVPNRGPAIPTDSKFDSRTFITKLAETVEVKTPPEPSTESCAPQCCPHLQEGLRHFHDPSLWSDGKVPVKGEVVLPENTKVLLSACSVSSQIFDIIRIPATSELIFDDQNIRLHVKNIIVEGAFRMGAPGCRLNADINIRFYGPRSTSDTSLGQFSGNKGIAVGRNAIFEVHGRRYYHTWTRLATTAFKGDDRVYLFNKVNWEAGQEVFITTTIWKDTPEFHQNERRIIRSVSDDGKVVQFTEPLEFLHYGGLEYQAEVGLLSRSIVMESGDIQESDASSYGGHIMIRGEARASGILFRRMGQKNVLGRYPIHFHLAGHQPSNFISDCACDQTYFRCITVHGTHDTLVTENVAFDVTGHALYMEDGVEVNNTISYNLMAFIRMIAPGRDVCVKIKERDPCRNHASGFCQWDYGNGECNWKYGYGQPGFTINAWDELIQPSDASASGYYITNTFNRIIHNAASGGFSGFSFPNLEYAVGDSFDKNYVPKNQPSLQLEGFTAHSSGYHWDHGSCIYMGGMLTYVDDNPSKPLRYNVGRQKRYPRDKTGKVWLIFKHVRTAMCAHGFGFWGEQMEVWNFETHDVRRGITLFGPSLLSYGLINAKSGNPVTGTGTPFTVDHASGFQFYDTWSIAILAHVTFRNFNEWPLYNDDRTSHLIQRNRAIVAMDHSDYFLPQGISAVIDIKFENTDKAHTLGVRHVDTSGSRIFNMVDHDGSFSRTPGKPKIIGSYPDYWKADDDCVKEPLLSDVWICDKVLGRVIANVRIQMPGITTIGNPGNDQSVHTGTIALWGKGITDVRSTVITGGIGHYGFSGLTVPGGGGWYIHPDDGMPTQFELKPSQVPGPEYCNFTIAVSYPAGTTFQVDVVHQYYTQRGFPNYSAAQNLQEAMDSDFRTGPKYYWDSTTNHLYIKMSNYIYGEPLYAHEGAYVHRQYESTRVTIKASKGGKVPFKLPTPFN